MKKFLRRLTFTLFLATVTAVGATVTAAIATDTAKPQIETKLPNAADSGKTVSKQKPRTTSITKKGDVSAENPPKKTPTKQAKIDLIPEGRELVSVNFDKARTEDIVKTMEAWTGKTIIAPSNLTGTASILSSTGKVTKLEAYQAFLAALKVSGYTTVETGKTTKIVKVDAATKENTAIFNSNQWSPRTEEVVTQIIKLDHIQAKTTNLTTSIVRIIQGMLPAAPKSYVTAYPPTNSLIVTASGHDINRVLSVLKHLDVEAQQRKIKIVPLRYSDPKSIASKITLIEPSARATSYSYSTQPDTFKILEDERTNSVILFGIKKKLDKFEAIIKTFDKKPSDPANSATIHVRPLDYAKAEDLEKTLSKLLQSKSSNQSSKKLLSAFTSTANNKNNTLGSTPSAEVLDNSVTISADKGTNSLIITGSRVAYNVLNSIIKKLDKRRKQVYIEAEIIEVTNNNDFKSDFSILAGDGDSNFMGLAGFQAGKGATGLASAGVLSGDASQKITALNQIAETFKDGFKVGLLGETVDILGFNIRPGVLINLLKEDGNSRTLSSPQILTLDNEPGTQITGEKFYYREQTTNQTTGQQLTTLKPENVDLTFKVTPNVSYSDYVTLDLDLEANTRTANTSSGIPIIAKRGAKQKITVKNGQTVVISGLLTHEERNSYSKIPLLGDIPGLGFFFRSTIKNKVQRNLMVFVTPHVVYGPSDLASIYRDKVKQRDDFIKHIYGSSAVNDDFYRLIPSLDDGVYRPTEIDKIEEERQKKQHAENLQMMGYTKDGDDTDGVKSSYKETIEQDLPLPDAPDAPAVPDVVTPEAFPVSPAQSKPQASNKKTLAQ